MKLAFSPQILEKRLDIKFHRNPSSGSRLVLCGPSDRHDGANCRFSHFCERPKNEVVTFTWPHYGTLYYHKPYNVIISILELPPRSLTSLCDTWLQWRHSKRLNATKLVNSPCVNNEQLLTEISDYVYLLVALKSCVSPLLRSQRLQKIISKLSPSQFDRNM